MEKNWVKIDNVGNDIEAEIIKDILKSEGIECKILYKGNLEYMKIMTGNILGTQGIDILVAAEEAEDAIVIIDAYKLQQTEEL